MKKKEEKEKEDTLKMKVDHYQHQLLLDIQATPILIL